MWKTVFISIALGLALPLVACGHQSKAQLPDKSKNVSERQDQSRLLWKCPAVSFERVHPDGTIDSWSICAVDVGNISVRINKGAIIPLGKLMSSEDVPPRSFDGYRPGETFEPEQIKRVHYISPRDPTKTIVAYEVIYSDCKYDRYTVYIQDDKKGGALAALDYVLDSMRLASLCPAEE